MAFEVKLCVKCYNQGHFALNLSDLKANIVSFDGLWSQMCIT